MGRLIPLLFLVEVALVALALISCLSAEDEEIRTLPRVGWVFVILLFPLVGSIAYFAAGRPVSATPRPGIWRVGGGFPEHERPRRPLAPDDDPEFLRSLSKPKDQQPKDPSD